ncbi:MAG: hypothetical protein IAI49_06360, partial [Candidatus Eremiobacteraeota bacterium]|nr:hypothetical protein [Candidatus Eremiobacteraeota bacterium]
MLEIRLLGAPEFALSGEPYRFAAPPRTLPLLAWLLVHRRAPLSRDALAFHFWPDLAEDEARGDLRRHLYYLTKALPAPSGEPWLLADKKTVGWNARVRAAIDLADFERLAADPATLEDAVKLYRGPFLEGTEDDWIEPERERLRALAERALAALVARYAEREPARAIEYAQQLVRVDPWREDAIRSLMTLRHRSGDRAGAMREYRDFVERLRAELDVEPMPETKAVFDSIAHATAPLADLRPQAAPANETNLPERSAPLIGRLQALEEIAELVRTSRLATLAGTGGVGKTRLAIDAGWTLLGEFPDGVWFADLAPITEASLVTSAFAAALGIALATERPPLGQIVASLRRKRLLLVADNCEHVVAEAARAIAEIVA